MTARWAIDVDAKAIAEARAAYSWYRERNEAAALAFIAELDEAIERISSSPRRWPTFVDDTRRYLLRRFPYSIVYRCMPDRVTILAVAHARRRPGFWKTRG